MTSEHKLKIGVLIGYYRKYKLKTTNLSKYVQQEFIIDQDTGNAICSVKILGKLENATSEAKTQIYEQLLKKLDMKFVEDDLLDASLEIMINDFYDAVAELHRIKAESIIERLETEIKEKSVYYTEIKQCMRAVVDFEFDYKFDRDIERFLLYARCTGLRKLDFLVSCMLLEVSFEVNTEQEMMSSLFKLKEPSNKEDILELDACILAKQIKGELIDTYYLLRSLLDEPKIEMTEARSSRFLLSLLFQEIYFNARGAWKAKFKKLNNILLNKSLPRSIRINTLILLIMLFYTAKSYDKVLLYIEIMLQDEPQMFYKVSAFYFSAKEELGLEIAETEFYRFKLNNCEKYYYIYFNYYRLKHLDRLSEIELLRYLVKEVKPALQNRLFIKKIIKIFKKEVIRLTSNTRMYNSFFDFNKQLNMLDVNYES